MKVFPRSIVFVFMALTAFMFCGCGSGDDDESSPAKDRLMVLTSPIFKVGESYKLYRGSNISVRNTDARYYVAPIEGDELVTFNLEFRDSISDDVPFVITTADDDTSVVFSYNPKGTTEKDTTTAYGSVVRYGGGTQQLMYMGLNVAGASAVLGSELRSSAIDLDTSDEITITLNGTTAKISSDNVPSYNYVWHADPNHRDEYFTEGSDSKKELTEEEMLAGITTLEGVYIAHDVRYTPNTVSFTGTAKNGEDYEYAAYYSDKIAGEAAKELGENFKGPYVFATLPPSKQQAGEYPLASPGSNSEIEAYSTMTHSASEAYSNPVLHITEAGVYRLKGTWNGQIWIDAGDDSDVALILDGVDVTCTVAPALVFYSARECGPIENVVSFDVGSKMLGDDELGHAGAIVMIADGTTNNFKGANVYRILKADKSSSAEKINGTDLADQGKMYKMDSAFYSFVSIAIGAENNNGGGRLNVTSTTYGGLGSELHMLIDSGTITVNAENDGVNVNCDDTPVFTMNGGSLKIVSKQGDGIDSDGWIVIKGGNLDITSVKDKKSLDAHSGIHISDNVTYTHQEYDAGSDTSDDTDEDDSGDTSSKKSVAIYNDNNVAVMRINYKTPVKDESNAGRAIPGSSEIFELQRKVNSFSGIKYKEIN